jgi:cystathionine gamma-synthase
MADQPREPWQIATSVVHTGERAPAPQATPTTTPIYTSATYLYPSLDALDAAFERGDGYVYTRYGNPTVAALEQAVTAIEGGFGAIALGSGMAALHAAVLAAGTPRGETATRPRAILAARDLYGSTAVLLRELFGSRGIPIVFCNMCDLGEVDAALAQFPAEPGAGPVVLLVEQLSNPLLRVVDIAGLARRAKAAGGRLVVDNTIATPVLQRPLSLGADLVVHSATKYLGGHGDAAGGVVVARASLVRDTLAHQARLLGASLGPFEAQQILRGLKTLALRVERQGSSAAQVAAWLVDRPEVARVYYPGLPSHAGHALAADLFGGRFGALVTFELAHGDRAALARFFDQLRLILPATTLGDVYSLATAPVISSHRELTPEQRAEAGIGEAMVRLSVGIEAVEDIIADLRAGLEAAGRP